MIILDTNVVAEPMKPNGNAVVQAWLDRQTAETLYLTATSFSGLLVALKSCRMASATRVLLPQ